MNGSNPIDKFSVYIAAGLVSGCGAMMLNVLPVFVGVMAETYAFSESQLGDIIAGYNLTFTVIAVSALIWIRRFNWRSISVGGVIIAALALMAMSVASGFTHMLILAGVVGLGLGALYALIMAVLGDSSDPDRAYGLKLGLETIPGAAMLFILPTLVAPAYGFKGVVISMAAVLILLGLASFWLPRAGVAHAASMADESNSSKSLVLSGLSLFASLAYCAGLVGSWAFLELLGTERGIAGESIGMVLSIGFLICGLGGFIAAVIGDRWGRILPFVFITGVNLTGLWLLSMAGGVTLYALGSGLFLFTINFGLAYTFGLTAVVDSTGKIVVLSAAVLSIGAVIGPFFGGRLVESSGFTALLMFSAACSLVALAVYLLTVFLEKKTSVSVKAAATAGA